jgi:quinol monooxygenase YgiN
MDVLQVTATFLNIRRQNLAEFKELAAEVLKVTAEESGVLQYDWFFNAEETKCVVREAYRGSEAVLAHLATVGEKIAPLVDAGGGLELEVFGSPSEQVVETIAMLRPTYYTYFQGK